MRIAFVIGVFPSLSETFILDQITGLLDAGHDVTIFANLGPGDSQSHTDVTRYGLIERTEYMPTVASSRVGRWIEAAGALARRWPAQPIRISRTAWLYGTHHEIGPRELHWMIKFLDRPFDIIQCHFGPAGLQALPLRGIGVPGKLVTTFHGYDVNSYPRTHGRDVYRDLFQRGDFFTANTEFTKGLLVELGCPADRIGIVPASMRVERFTFRPRCRASGETVKVLSVGRLVEKKGQEYALRALGKVVERERALEYWIVGDGPLRGSLEELTRRLRIDRCVRFWGALDQQSLLELYREAHLFCLPSVTAADGDREGQALVLQEAQAIGLPVLSTLHNGIPEGVLDGQSGFLTPERDVNALAERWCFLLDHPEQWAEMGRQGRSFVEQKYDVPVVTEKLVGIYRRLLGGDKAAGG